MSYISPRVKPIYPLYKLNSNIFRIGAQLGITTEIEEEDNQFWTLANLLNSKNKLDHIITSMQKNIPS